MPCHRDPALGEMYALVRSQGLLEGRLKALAHQVSDANLQQMPDFQQRVEVLRRLDYIAQDNTVQLKVRSLILYPTSALLQELRCSLLTVHWTRLHCRAEALHYVTVTRITHMCASRQVWVGSYKACSIIMPT